MFTFHRPILWNTQSFKKQKLTQRSGFRGLVAFLIALEEFLEEGKLAQAHSSGDTVQPAAEGCGSSSGCDGKRLLARIMVG